MKNKASFFLAWPHPWDAGDGMIINLTIYSHLIREMHQIKKCIHWPCSFQKDLILLKDNARRTMNDDDDGQKLTAIGHISDLGDLTMIAIYLSRWNVMSIPGYLNRKLDFHRSCQGNYPSD